jgi:hypothetical protein
MSVALKAIFRTSYSLSSSKLANTGNRYWDWTLDASNALESPIWDPVTGFGGDGSSAKGCVQGGPLQKIVLNYTADGLSPHCLSRSFDNSDKYGEMHGFQYAPEIIDDILAHAKTYEEFRERLENGPHKHIHDGIGGEMPGSSSTNGKFHTLLLPRTLIDELQIHFSSFIMLR